MDEKPIQKTLDYQVAIPLWGNYKRGFTLEEFMELYKQNWGIIEIADKLGVSHTKLSQIMREYNIPQRTPIKFKQSFKYKLIDPPEHLKLLIEDRDLYKLQSSYCDYMAKKIDSNTCMLIEEKETLSNYNYGYAVMQLLLGEQIIKNNLNLEVERKILFCHKSQKRKKAWAMGKIDRFIVDVKTYLNVDIIINSVHNSTNIINPISSTQNGEKT